MLLSFLIPYLWDRLIGKDLDFVGNIIYFSIVSDFSFLFFMEVKRGVCRIE